MFGPTQGSGGLSELYLWVVLLLGQFAVFVTVIILLIKAVISKGDDKNV